MDADKIAAQQNDETTDGSEVEGHGATALIAAKPRPVIRGAAEEREETPEVEGHGASATISVSARPVIRP